MKFLLAIICCFCGTLQSTTAPTYKWSLEITCQSDILNAGVSKGALELTDVDADFQIRTITWRLGQAPRVRVARGQSEVVEVEAIRLMGSPLRASDPEELMSTLLQGLDQFSKQTSAPLRLLPVEHALMNAILSGARILKEANGNDLLIQLPWSMNWEHHATPVETRLLFSEPEGLDDARIVGSGFIHGRIRKENIGLGRIDLVGDFLAQETLHGGARLRLWKGKFELTGTE